MMRRPASLSVGLALLALATSGCFTPQGDGVFGPAGSLGGEERDGAGPALSIKASPARGPGPLVVGFSLSARGGEGGGLAWSLDFGDRSAPAAGTELPAKPSHTYESPGAYVATFKVRGDAGESVSTLSIVVLEGLTSATGQPSPTQGPSAPPAYSGPRPPPASSTSTSTTTASQTTTDTPSNSSTSTPPPSGANSTNGTNSTSTTPPAPSSSSASPTPEPTSSTTTTSETATSTSDAGTPTTSASTSDTASATTDPSTSSTDSPTPSPTPGPTSQSQSSTDPPL